MAKIKEMELSIKLSKLVKNENDDSLIIPDSLLLEIESIIQELVGTSVVVELS